VPKGGDIERRKIATKQDEEPSHTCGKRGEKQKEGRDRQQRKERGTQESPQKQESGRKTRGHNKTTEAQALKPCLGMEMYGSGTDQL